MIFFLSPSDTNWLSITEASIKANVTKETLTELNAKLILVCHVLKFPLLKQQKTTKNSRYHEANYHISLMVLRYWSISAKWLENSVIY